MIRNVGEHAERRHRLLARGGRLCSGTQGAYRCGFSRQYILPTCVAVYTAGKPGDQ
jgi:hypothetical protein